MIRSPIEKFTNSIVALAKIFAKLAIYFVIIYFVGSILFNQGYKLFYEYAVDPNDESYIEFNTSSGDSLEAVSDDL